MKLLLKIETILNGILMIMGGIALIGLMLLATGNVVMRIVHLPFHGAYEMVGFLCAVVTAFALGYTQKRKEHVEVDIVTQKFSPRLLRVVESLKYFLCLVFFAIVSRQVFLWGIIIYRTGELSETLKITYYPFVFFVAIGFLALTFTLLIDFIVILSGNESR